MEHPYHSLHPGLQAMIEAGNAECFYRPDVELTRDEASLGDFVEYHLRMDVPLGRNLGSLAASCTTPLATVRENNGRIEIVPNINSKIQPPLISKVQETLYVPALTEAANNAYLMLQQMLSDH